MNAPLALDTQGSMPLRDSRFTVPGMRCAGCISKIERGLAKLEGVDAARVNFSAKRVAVRHHERLGEDDLVEAIAAIGFEAQPVADNPMARDDRESAALMRALAVAGFGMMNIMLLSVSVWSGAEGVTRDLFHWLSAMIALPVVAYAGRPFFASAAMALRHRRTNMDVPISIGVLLATGLSLYETIAGTGHAYFDSAVMLLFFLLAGRALDATMRNRTRAGIGALLSRMGRSAMVLDESGAHRTVAAEDLDHQIGADVSRADDGNRVALCSGHRWLFQVKSMETRPRPDKSADAVSPAWTNTAAVIDPDMTNSPACSPVSNPARAFTSHATASAG